MNEPEKTFSSELIEQQIEQADRQLPLPEARLIHELQELYDQEKRAALDRVWTRLDQHRTAAHQPGEPLSAVELPRWPARRRPMQPEHIPSGKPGRFARVLSLCAAAAVCFLLVGSLALLFHARQNTTTPGSRPADVSTPTPLPTPAPTETGSSQGEGKIISRWSYSSPALPNIRSLSWSPDSKLLASDSQDGVEIRKAATGEKLLRITPGGLFAAWSPNGKYLAIDSRIYNAQSGLLVRDLLASPGVASTVHSPALSDLLPYSGGSGVYTVAWSPDSKLLAGAVFGQANGGNKVVIWNVSTGQAVYTFSGQSADTVGSLSWSANGQYIASASFDGVIKAWDARTGHVIFQHADKERVEGLAWSHTGMMLAFFSGNNTIEVWDIARKTLITSHASDTWAPPVWSPDDNRIASTNQNSVALWDATSGATLYTLTGQKHTQITALAWSPDGTSIASTITSTPNAGATGTPGISLFPTISILVWLA